MIRRSLRLFLENADVSPSDIYEADGGLEGVQMQQEVRPDFVLLDIEMPDLSGDEAIVQMLENDPEVKVIIVSAHPREDPRITQAISIGAYEALQKPVRQNEITSLVNLMRKERRGAGTIL